MSNDTALILRNDSTLSVQWTAEANKLKEDALTIAAGVGKVTDASTNQKAVEAQQAVAAIRKQVEAARVACKAPVLAFGKKIDDAARDFDAELASEQIRLNRLVGDFMQLEQQRIRAEQQKENERLAAIEREREAALAKATTHEQVDKVQEQFNNRVQQEAPPIRIAPRAEGQRVTPTVEFEVFDIDALYRAYPLCVTMTPKVLEVKALLKAGVQIPGVRRIDGIKATVSTRSAPKPIDV